MSSQEDSDNFNTYKVTGVTQESVSHTTDVDGFVRSVGASASSDVTITLTVGEEEVANYIGTTIHKGEFGDPITEVGAEQTVEVSVEEDEDTALNLVVDEYKG